MYVTYVHFAATCMMGKEEEEVSKENSLLMVFSSLSPTTVCTALQTHSVNRSEVAGTADAGCTEGSSGSRRGEGETSGEWSSGVVIWL